MPSCASRPSTGRRAVQSEKAKRVPAELRAPGARVGPWPRFRTVNLVAGYLGIPGTGKTTRALADMVRCSAAHGGARLLAHDTGMRVPERWPDAWGGGATGLVQHATTDRARAALAKGVPGIHVISCADGSDVLALAVEIGDATMAQSKDGTGPPVFVLLDEAVGVAAMSPHRIGDGMREFIATRRHHHVGLYWTTQSPQFAHYAILGLSTSLTLGTLHDRRALRRLEELGIDEDVLALVPDLPPHQFLEVEL